MSNSILDSLNRRYATKIFDTKKKLSDSDVQLLMEILRLAPSSFGMQPWKFLIIEDPHMREKLKSLSRNQRQITEASHLIVLCAKKTIDVKEIQTFINVMAKDWNQNAQEIIDKRDEIGKTGRILSHYENEHGAKYDVFTALGFLLCACATLGIDACPMGGFDKQGYDEMLGLLDTNYRSVVLCTLGYRSKEDKYALLPKARFSYEDIVEKI